MSFSESGHRRVQWRERPRGPSRKLEDFAGLVGEDCRERGQPTPRLRLDARLGYDTGTAYRAQKVTHIRWYDVLWDGVRHEK